MYTIYVKSLSVQSLYKYILYTWKLLQSNVCSFWGSIAKTEIKSAYQITIYSQIKLNTSHLLSHPTLGRGSNLTWTYDNLNYIYQTFYWCVKIHPPPHCCPILVPGDHVLKKGIYPTWGCFITSFSLFGSMVFEKTFFFYKCKIFLLVLEFKRGYGTLFLKAWIPFIQGCLCLVGLKLPHGFRRRSKKCENLTDGRRTKKWSV